MWNQRASVFLLSRSHVANDVSNPRWGSSSISSQEACFRGTSFWSVAGHGVRYAFSMNDEFHGPHQGGHHEPSGERLDVI